MLTPLDLMHVMALLDKFKRSRNTFLHAATDIYQLKDNEAYSADFEPVIKCLLDTMAGFDQLVDALNALRLKYREQLTQKPLSLEANNV